MLSIQQAHYELQESKQAPSTSIVCADDDSTEDTYERPCSFEIILIQELLCQPSIHLLRYRQIDCSSNARQSGIVHGDMWHCQAE